MNLSPSKRSILHVRPAPRQIPRTVVAVRPAGAQLAAAEGDFSAVVRAGPRSGRRVQLSPSSRMLETVDIAVSSATAAVWLCEREWFADRCGSTLPAIEAALVDVATESGTRFHGWTAESPPRRTEAYGVVEGLSPSTDPALDRPGE